MKEKLKITLTRNQALLAVFAAAALVAAVILVEYQNFKYYIDDISMSVVELKKTGTKLSLATASERVKVGQTFTVDIRLDSQDTDIDGVDLYSLKFDPEYLTVVDADRSTTGTQIISAGLLPITVVNRVDQNKGLIQFAQVTEGGTTFKGKGKLATVTFKTLKNGATDLNFDFIPGNTTDTNVAAHGQDQLTTVESLKLVIEK
jgi:hypothetical protein